METPPLRVGNVLFADGNAAARTFGRAHRHRPYHFSYGSVFQGCRKRLRRRTKTRKGCRKSLCRPTKTRNDCRKSLCRPTKMKNDCRKSLCRPTKTKNDCRKSLCRRTENKKNRRNGKFLRSDFGLMRKKAYFYATFCAWT